jgi:hypothetical protein
MSLDHVRIRKDCEPMRLRCDGCGKERDIDVGADQVDALFWEWVKTHAGCAPTTRRERKSKETT